MSDTYKDCNMHWPILNSYWYKITIAALFSFWAGSFNSLSSIAILFERSAHMSGRIADIGIYVVFHPIHVILMIIVWASFVSGSFLAGILLPKIGLTRCFVILSLSILVASKLVFLGISGFDESDYGIERFLKALILPFAMGFQNSLTSQLPLDRTTHWTGASTDLGIAFSKRDWSTVVFICSKIFSFIVGAAIFAFLIAIQNFPPQFGLALISGGILVTTFLGDRLNKRFLLQSNADVSRNKIPEEYSTADTPLGVGLPAGSPTPRQSLENNA